MIMVTHSSDAASYADRILLLKEAKLSEMPNR
jgi:ABC-type lipoprotein export system ATPase subunit